MPSAPAAPKAPSVPRAPIAPGGLPPEWTEHKDPATGKVYYYNKITKETSWQRPPGKSGASPILLLAFDFDCTISSLHLFEHLYRRGGVDIPSQISVLQQQCYEDPNFTAQIFGGRGRIEDLRRFFQALHRNLQRRLVIITTGFGPVVEAALERVDLLAFFFEVIGRDHPLSEVKQGRKDRIIKELQQQHGFSSLQTLFVDDDPANVLPAAEHRICRTVWVPRPTGGMDSIMLRMIREAAEDTTGESNRLFREDFSLAVGPPQIVGAPSLHAAVQTAYRR